MLGGSAQAFASVVTDVLKMMASLVPTDMSGEHVDALLSETFVILVRESR